MAFLPYLVALCAAVFLVLPLGYAVLLTAVMSGVGWIDSYLHHGLHVRGFWLEPFRRFHRLRALHLQHHRDTRTTFGIHMFLWDHLAGTFREPAPESEAEAGPAGRDLGARIGPVDGTATPLVVAEYLVAVAVGPPREAGRIELHAVYAKDEAAALEAASDPARGLAARKAVPLSGDVLALWNELGRVAFGFGR